MQANLVLESTDTGGKKQTTTITHIRPSEKSHANELAIALNALTTNTYVGAKVNEINVDITASQNLPQEISVTYQSASSTYVYTVHRLGTGTISVYNGATEMTVDQSTGTFSYNSPGPYTILVDSDETYSQGFLIYTRS